MFRNPNPETLLRRPSKPRPTPRSRSPRARRKKTKMRRRRGVDNKPSSDDASSLDDKPQPMEVVQVREGSPRGQSPTNQLQPVKVLLKEATSSLDPMLVTNGKQGGNVITIFKASPQSAVNQLSKSPVKRVIPYEGQLPRPLCSATSLPERLPATCQLIQCGEGRAGSLGKETPDHHQEETAIASRGSEDSRGCPTTDKSRRTYSL